LSLFLTKAHAMKTYGGVEVDLHAFLTSALDDANRFTLGGRPPHPHPLGRRGRSGRSGEEIKSLALPGIEPRPSSPYPSDCTHLPRFPLN